ncbi:MAG TPA: phosphatase PAP2 family protein [Candidatus Thermoplasmatota archaeon]|nr:phosphatase PAP2 family protein [Candidatus Thermoplasmatota archaeon]
MTPRQWQGTGVVAGTTLFLAVTADFLLGGPVSGLDQAIYDRITAWQDDGVPVHWWAEAVTRPTAPLEATLITTVVVAWWWARGQRGLALWGGGTGLVAGAVITVLKQGFQRDLPPMAAGAWYGFSFPSGHTIGAAANLGILILFAAQTRVDRRGLMGAAASRTWTLALVAWAMLTLLVGIGRVLTQRHWASDVLASWGIGAALACGALLLARVPSHPATVPGATASGPHPIERAT